MALLASLLRLLALICVVGIVPHAKAEQVKEVNTPGLTLAVGLVKKNSARVVIGCGIGCNHHITGISLHPKPNKGVITVNGRHYPIGMGSVEKFLV